MTLAKSFFTALLMLATLQAVAQPLDPPPRDAPQESSRLLKASIDRIVAAEMERQDAVGVAVGVVRDGKVLFTSGYGLADREQETPVTNETMFRWASISKPLTAVLAGQLAAEGAT